MTKIYEHYSIGIFDENVGDFNFYKDEMGAIYIVSELIKAGLWNMVINKDVYSCIENELNEWGATYILNKDTGDTTSVE